MVLYVAYEYASGDVGCVQPMLKPDSDQRAVGQPVTTPAYQVDPKSKFEDAEEGHTKRLP